jgi:exopolysaccharide biosynthesis protein
VGLTLLVEKNAFPIEWKVNDELEIKINGLNDIDYAVEAGPLLIDNGKTVLNMEVEGWKTNNSIRTQAARLDFTDMRGPKIAAGIDKNDNLIVLTINGRIRESVGATHYDMAEILTKFDIKQAMGFDPGGSSTLVVNGQTVNISPYNSNYEQNIYSLPPEPRAVSNVIMGYITNK